MGKSNSPFRSTKVRSYQGPKIRGQAKNVIRKYTYGTMKISEGDYTRLRIFSDRATMIRSQTLETLRVFLGKVLEDKIGRRNFFIVLNYPHQVIREKKILTGAGADRLSDGMRNAFGKPTFMSLRSSPKRGKIADLYYKNNVNPVYISESLRKGNTKFSAMLKSSIIDIVGKPGESNTV